MLGRRRSGMGDEVLEPVASSDALDALTAERVGDTRCWSCSRLLASNRCELRSTYVAAPSESVCADHPDFVSKKARHPLGPVFRVQGRSLRIAEELQPTPAVRRSAIEVLAAIDAASPDEL